MLATPAVRDGLGGIGGGAYPAAVGEGAIGSLRGAAEVLPGDLPARTFCIADPEALAHHSAAPLAARRPSRSRAESSKTIAEAERVLRRPADAAAAGTTACSPSGAGCRRPRGLLRRDLPARGIPWSRRPPRSSRRWTRLRGKDGADLPEANYVGAYHLPIAVLADPTTLETLPGNELAAGFVEVVKTALIAGDRCGTGSAACSRRWTRSCAM